MSDIKPSEIFEGENSSLRKTYNEAIMSDIKQKAREMFDERYINLSTPSGLNQREYGSHIDMNYDIRDVFIDQIVDLAIAEENKRICKLIKTIGATGTEEEVDKMIYLITNNK